MALSVRDLTVHYGTFAAVRDARLDIADGEVLALLGPSGSGKSTLLRAITGLEPSARGSVSWDGEDLGAVPVHRRGFGLVFQDGQLFTHRDVAANIAFGLRMHGVPRAQWAPRVAELLELVGLAGFERRRVTELSGGQAQRVALARALAPEPRLLLLDEPLSGLDAGLREQLAIDLADLLRRSKITALLVTHDQEEAFTLADRVAAGRLACWDPATATWSAVGNAPTYDDDIRALAVIGDRWLVIGGDFHRFFHRGLPVAEGLWGTAMFDLQAERTDDPLSGYVHIPGTS
ncbi:ABC transporter ATP-binding protein, partial [Amycolatopsis sp.]|uniref:ABC transporter ATP-binding protein n=1 Tax=Amycolatopsis sp. TaxID=37632 RepID=UPI002D7F7A48